MFSRIQKRDGTIEEFNIEKFQSAIENAAEAVGQLMDIDKIAADAIALLERQAAGADITSVENSLNAIEISLMQNNYVDVAKAFIIYRNRHSRVREQNSVFTKAIDDVSLDFEIRGNAAEWLWEVAHITSYCYTIYKILPQQISHYFTENYIWIHSLPYFGRTIRNISFDLAEVFSSNYFKSKHIKPAKRLMVLINHLLQVDDAIHDDIGGEHVYRDFDISLDKLITALPQKPSKTDLQQAAEYFVYTLNNKSITHTTDKLNTPCINIGLNSGELGNLFIKYMLEALLRISDRSTGSQLPFIVYKVQDGVNWSDEDPNFGLFSNCLALAQHRGNVNFIWAEPTDDRVFYSNGIAQDSSRAVNMQLTLNLPKIAFNSRGNFYENLNNIMNITDEIINLQGELLGGRTAENFPTLSKLCINGKVYSGEEKFSNIFQESNIAIGITGLLETVKIINPNASFTEMSEIATEILRKIKKRVRLQNRQYRLISTYDLKITNALFENDRQRQGFIQSGVSRYSPGITLLPIGYNIRDRINLEKVLYDNFDMPVPVLIQRDKSREEILEGIMQLKNSNAFIAVI